MPRDIVERLRDRAYAGLPDPLLAEAADEIERLRLTDAEREAIGWAIELLDAREEAMPTVTGKFFAGAATLRGLLERLGN